jgi:hypothetical protein
MIYSKEVTIRGKQYIRTWSDVGQICRDGEVYGEAIDPVGTDRVYTEVATDTEKEEE